MPLKSSNQCVFCNLEAWNLKVIRENSYGEVFFDGFPVTEYHSLIIPKRHIADYFDLTEEELSGLNKLIKEQKEYLQSIDDTITGFNIGVNSGQSAGQTVFHVHIHLIPRRNGDMENPKGGVRGVIPDKQKY